MTERDRFVPDFERVRTALGFREPDRVPHFEVCVAPCVLEALLGRPLPDGVAGEAIWRLRLGYDFLYVVPPYRRPPVYSRKHLTGVTPQGTERSWTDQHSGMIRDWASFREYRDYPEPAAPLDLTDVRAAIAAAKDLPGKTGVGALLPACPFTEMNLLMGYAEFAVALYDDREFCCAVVDRLGAVGVAAAEQLAAEDIDFIFFGDDMAYTESMMIAPDVMREMFFPWYRRFIEIARDGGKLVMFHSDGNIEPVIPDFIAAGLNGLNPIEPEAMDIVDLKRRYGREIALIGNIDVDLLSRGTPAEVRDLVRRRMEALKPGGGYMLASSNSVCDYAKPENYAAMLDAGRDYGVRCL